MRITKRQLRKIVQEAKMKSLNEYGTTQRYDRVDSLVPNSNHFYGSYVNLRDEEAMIYALRKVSDMTFDSALEDIEDEAIAADGSNGATLLTVVHALLAIGADQAADVLLQHIRREYER